MDLAKLTFYFQQLPFLVPLFGTVGSKLGAYQEKSNLRSCRRFLLSRRPEFVSKMETFSPVHEFQCAIGLVYGFSFSRISGVGRVNVYFGHLPKDRGKPDDFLTSGTSVTCSCQFSSMWHGWSLFHEGAGASRTHWMGLCVILAGLSCLGTFCCAELCRLSSGGIEAGGTQM